jgi:hypothetical protein
MSADLMFTIQGRSFARRQKARRQLARVTVTLSDVSSNFTEDVDRIIIELGSCHLSGARWLLGWAYQAMLLTEYETLFIASTAVAICLEASSLGICGSEWEILACAFFQTLSYFSDYRFGFEAWRKMAHLHPAAITTLLTLMRLRGWRTKVLGLPALHTGSFS